MTQPCPGWPTAWEILRYGGKSLNPPAHMGGYCCWACDHGWDDARCTCLEPPNPEEQQP